MALAVHCENPPRASPFSALLPSEFDPPYFGRMRPLAGCVHELLGIQLKAKTCANICVTLRCYDEKASLESMHGYAEHVGIRRAEGDHDTAIIARYCAPGWWQRRLFADVVRQYEHDAIRRRDVSEHVDKYISDLGLDLFKQRMTHNDRLMSAIICTSDAGDECTLKEIQERTVSNPEIRRAELMCRIDGHAQIAEQQGHVAEFYTFTCPGRMHAGDRDKASGNPNYDDTSPEQAQDYLNDLWAKMRAAFHYEGIRVYGFRIAEPHHDGTPHWHLLLFMEESKTDRVRQIMRQYLTQDKTDKNLRPRFKAIRIDPSKGSPAAYIAKYIAKNIDGFGNEVDRVATAQGHKYSGSAEDAALRVRAWASMWGIRQFQQIGNPPVCVWRELRRIKTEITAFSENQQHAAELLEAARRAADEGDWAKYCKLNGIDAEGPPPITLLSKDPEPGELNLYGELSDPVIIGVQCQGMEITTRIVEWEQRLDPRSFFSEFGHGSLPSRSTDNNCRIQLE
ncbi:MAG: replication endonuclease [Gammaproteobacteria bacterium]|nr:replication endonuclease [Gammaproteobacteria bacterium]